MRTRSGIISLLFLFCTLLNLVHIAWAIRPSGSTIGAEKAFKNRRRENLVSKCSLINQQGWQHGGGGMRRYRCSDYFNTKMIRDSDSPLDDSDTIWSPAARNVMAGLASIGAVETGYLTFVKLTQGSVGLQQLCSTTSGSDSSCGLVLGSVYATIEGVPLTLYGFCGTCCLFRCLFRSGSMCRGLGYSANIQSSFASPSFNYKAYTAVAFLALFPIIYKHDPESAKLMDGENRSRDYVNRILLLIITTSMATFSIYLLSILVFVLKTSCQFCVVSAVLSVSLGLFAWFGGAIGSVGSQARKIVLYGLLSFCVTTLASVTIYGNLDNHNVVQSATAASDKQELDYSPPQIVSSSNERALLLTTELQSLNSRFFGAYWCSHCYEQKERLGKEGMSRIPYIECSKEGKNSQADLCKARKIPGYPTWEISSELFPGEQSIEELENIVKDIKKKRSFLTE